MVGVVVVGVVVVGVVVVGVVVVRVVVVGLGDRAPGHQIVEVDRLPPGVGDRGGLQDDRQALAARDLGHHRRYLPGLVDGLGERVRVQAVARRLGDQVVDQLALGHRHLLGVDDGVEDEPGAQRLADLLGHLRTVLVVGEPVLALEVGVHLGLDQGVGDGDLDRLEQRVEHLVAGAEPGLELLVLLDLGAQVGLQLVEGLELGRQLGELVVGLGQLALLHRHGGDGDLRGLAGVVAAGQGGLEGGLLAGGQAGEGLVEAVDHVAGADLVADALGRVDLLLADPRHEVEGDEVALARRAVDADEGAEALAQRVEALVDVGVGDLVVVDLHRQRGVLGQRDLGTHVDLDGELQVAAFRRVGDVGDVDLGTPERTDPRLVGGLAVQAGQGVVDGLLQHGAAADALVDDARRDLALAEAGDRDLRADRLVGGVHVVLELLERDLDGQLDPGRVEVLDVALHAGAPGDAFG